MAEFKLSEWQRWVIVRQVPEGQALLDFLDRVNELPDGTITVRGEVDRDGQSPTGPAEHA